MKNDVEDREKTFHDVASDFSTVNRYSHPSTEEFMNAARKMMKLYDEAFRELAK